MEKQNKKKNIFKIIKAIVKTIFFILIVGFILVVCLQRFSGNKISFFDYRMFTVISGSMKPKYDIGDVLISKKTNAKDIEIGDTISYLGMKGDFKNKVITHQVIGIEKDNNGNIIFRAKGLANLVEDPIVYESQLYGVVVYRSVILSTIYKIVATKLGFYLFIILPMVFIIGSEIVSSLLEKEEKRREKLKNN